MTHRSRLAGFIIDCETGDVDHAAGFWSNALGLPLGDGYDDDGASYVELRNAPGELHVEVQRVDHPSRVHLEHRVRRHRRRSRAPGTPGREEDQIRQTLVGDGSADRPPLLRGAHEAPGTRRAAQGLGLIAPAAVAPPARAGSEVGPRRFTLRRFKPH